MAGVSAPGCCVCCPRQAKRAERMLQCGAALYELASRRRCDVILGLKVERETCRSSRYRETDYPRMWTRDEGRRHNARGAWHGGFLLRPRGIVDALVARRDLDQITEYTSQCAKIRYHDTRALPIGHCSAFGSCPYDRQCSRSHVRYNAVARNVSR